MAWIAGFFVTGSSGTFPAIQAGDLLVITAVRWSSGTAPAAPSGWTSSSSSTSTYGRRVGYRYAASSSTGASTSVWTNAEALYVSVWRNVSIGNTASTASSSKAGGPPALTLTQPGTSWVGLMSSGDGVAPNLPTGMTERLRASGSGVNDLYADTNGSVSSWAAQTGNAEIVTVIELIPNMAMVGGSSTTSWLIEQAVGGSLATSWGIDTLMVGGTRTTSWLIEQAVGGSLATSWEIIADANWRANISSTAFREALLAPHRQVSARAELVYLTGQPATYLVNGTPIEMDFDHVSVEYSGELEESWSARFSSTNPAWVPTGADHPLDPRSQYAIRLYWQLYVHGDRIELPIGTFRPDSPTVHDTGTVEISWTGRDMLSVAKGAGYGGQVIDVGGWTVTKALQRLFATISPRQALRVAETTTTLPAVYSLGSKTPEEDWEDLAAMAGWVARTDREGVIVIGPPPDPASIARSLQEGDDCPVFDLKVDYSSVTYNRVVVRSSSYEVDPPVWGYAEDTDPGSPTWIGNGVIRELTIDSDAVTTTEACTNMAKMHLGKYLRPTAAVSVTIPADPTLNYRDRVVLGRAKAAVGGQYRVSKTEMDLPINGTPPGFMTVTMMREAIA